MKFLSNVECLCILKSINNQNRKKIFDNVNESETGKTIAAYWISMALVCLILFSQVCGND